MRRPYVCRGLVPLSDVILVRRTNQRYCPSCESSFNVGKVALFKSSVSENEVREWCRGISAACSFCAMIPLILWFHDSAYIIRHRLAECSFHLCTNMRDFSSTYIKFVHAASFWRREPVSRQVSGCFQCQQVLRKCWATESAQLLYILRPLHTYVHEWQKALFYGARRFLSSRAEFRHLSLKSCMCFFPSCTWEREI